MSDQELARVDSGRRDFLKKSLVTGAVIWGAPAVTSLPGGRAWAQTYGQCTCNGSAYGLRIIVPNLGYDQTFGEDGSVVDVDEIPIGGSVSGTVITGNDSSSVDGSCGGNASIATLGVFGGPGFTVEAELISSQASATCDGCGTSGSSNIALLEVNGVPIAVTGTCNFDVLGNGAVIINEQSCDANGNLTVNAIHVTEPGQFEVIAAHSVAGATGCPCVACA